MLYEDDSKKSGFFSLLPSRAKKSRNYRYRYIWKSDNYTGNQEMKQKTKDKKKANRLKAMI